MSFPSESELKMVRKKLAKATGTLMLAPNATPLERFRFDICQKFVVYKQKHKLSLEEMAKTLGTDKAKVSKILRHRIESFSTDRLVTWLQIIYPETKLKVA
ncbi:MAG: XRE family transcriptional regulator [Bdellovibrionota bacterium]